MKTTYQLTKYRFTPNLFEFMPNPWIHEIIDNGLTHIEVLEGKEALEATSSFTMRRTSDTYSFKIGDKIQLPNTINSKQFKYFSNKESEMPTLKIYCYYHKVCSNPKYPIKLNAGFLIQSTMNCDTKERFQINGQITQYANNTMTECEAWTNLLGKTLVIMDVVEVPIIRRGFNRQPDRKTTTNIYTINVENTINPISEDIEVEFHYAKEPEERQAICFHKMVVLSDDDYIREFYMEIDKMNSYMRKIVVIIENRANSDEINHHEAIQISKLTPLCSAHYKQMMDLVSMMTKHALTKLNTNVNRWDGKSVFLTDWIISFDRFLSQVIKDVDKRIH